LRSGDEPATARSALRLRLSLAFFGLLAAAAGAAMSIVLDEVVWALVFAAVAVVAIVDAGIVQAHRRQGSHYQPGPQVPPYRPIETSGSPRAPSRPRSARRRTRLYLILMGTCLTLIALSWIWLRTVSTPAAVVLSLIAMVIPPLAAIVANAGWAGDPDQQDPPRRRP
jgi:hypothetical protein